MKKHLISIVAVLVVLAVVLVSFGQAERTRRPRMSREERIKAIESIEAQLAKLKEGGQRPTFNRDSFQNIRRRPRRRASFLPGWLQEVPAGAFSAADDRAARVASGAPNNNSRNPSTPLRAYPDEFEGVKKELLHAERRRGIVSKAAAN